MNLITRYMGLRLSNPLIASASPINGELGTLRALEDHGAGAVVLPSIFEEQIRAEQAEHALRTEGPANASAEAQTYFPAYGGYGFGPERYLEILRQAKDALDIPVIASLNCASAQGWKDYAASLQLAGADAVELNIHFVPADPAVDGREVEQRHLDIVSDVKAALNVPLAVKIGPCFSAVGHMATALVQAGADGLVLFNRFHEPDIDIRTLTLSTEVELSTSKETRLALQWISILHGRIAASLAASTGVESADDVYKYLLAGADTVMTTSALLRHGVKHMRVLLDGLVDLLHARRLDSLDSVRGRMSRNSLGDATALERARYIRMLQSYRVVRPG